MLRIFRGRFGEISIGEMGFALAFLQLEKNAALHIWFGLWNSYIKLPKCVHKAPDWDRIMLSYGFSWRWGKYDLGRYIHLNWGARFKILHMPWSWEHVRHDILMINGGWQRMGAMPRLGEGDFDAWRNPPGQWVAVHDYTYTLKNGTIQERKATIRVEEREWRWRWFQWLPFPRRISRCICVEFNGEVGERAGSWKGDCVGCGYEMLPGESALQTLRRMERERTF